MSDPNYAPGKREFRVLFVPFGTNLKEEMKPGYIAVDVGNGEPEEGIFDHHHFDTPYRSAAELLWHKRDYVVARLHQSRQIVLLCHQQPDLDCLVSAYLVILLAREEKLEDMTYIEQLIEYVSKVDQGISTLVSELNLHTFMLTYDPWRRSLEADHLLSPPGTLCGPIDGLNWPGPEKPCGIEGEMILVGAALIEAMRRERLMPDAPIPLDFLGKKLAPAFSSLQAFIHTEYAHCRDEYARIRAKKWVSRMTANDNLGRPRKVAVLRSVDPVPNPGMLVRFLRAIVPAEEGLEPLVVIQKTTGDRTVVSVAPESGLHLKGLAISLDRMELRRRRPSGNQDMGIPRYQCRNPDGKAVIDPYFPGSDPWYDGRGHNYTIVDAPRSGSVLGLDEIFSFIKSGEWTKAAALYESPGYRAWLQTCGASGKDVKIPQESDSL